MSAKRCYYETLEVERTADDGSLKAAFRKLAMKWHPDKNPGDATSEMRFKEINEAYEVLKDGDKRAAYDRFGHAAFEQGMGGGGPGFGAGFAAIEDTIRHHDAVEWQHLVANEHGEARGFAMGLHPVGGKRPPL